MKVLLLAKIAFAGMLLAFIAGCASDMVYIPKVPPSAQAKLLDYYEQADNKVFVIATDPSGNCAFGYEYGKPTIKEAAKAALEKCQASREERGVMAKPHVYAINNKIVYEEMIRMSAADKRKSLK